MIHELVALILSPTDFHVKNRPSVLTLGLEVVTLSA